MGWILEYEGGGTQYRIPVLREEVPCTPGSEGGGLGTGLLGLRAKFWNLILESGPGLGMEVGLQGLREEASALYPQKSCLKLHFKAWKKPRPLWPESRVSIDELQC